MIDKRMFNHVKIFYKDKEFVTELLTAIQESYPHHFARGFTETLFNNHIHNESVRISFLEDIKFKKIVFVIIEFPDGYLEIGFDTIHMYGATTFSVSTNNSPKVYVFLIDDVYKKIQNIFKSYGICVGKTPFNK